MDPQQASQPAEPAVAQDQAAASDQPRESQSSWMNNAIRSVAGMFNRAEPTEPTQEPATEPDATAVAAERPQPAETTPDPETVTLTRAELAERERAWQSQADRQIAQTRREWATERASQGDTTPMRQLADRGDRWAQQQLEQNGDTWALGEIKAAELAAERAREMDPLPIMAAQFDQTVLHPLLGALPEADEQRIVGRGIVGLDGRKAAVEQAIVALKAHAADEALTKAMTDESYAKRLLAEGSALRRALLTNPTVNKQLRAVFRPTLDEPDVAQGAGPARGGERQTDFMNNVIRDAWRGAEERGQDERAAQAGARNGRLSNRDVLDDE